MSLIENDIKFKCSRCESMVNNYYIVPLQTKNEQVINFYKLCIPCYREETNSNGVA